MSEHSEYLIQERQWRRELRRRLAYFLILLAALIVGLLFVRWVSRDLGLGRIGEFYGQADELSVPE